MIRRITKNITPVSKKPNALLFNNSPKKKPNANEQKKRINKMSRILVRSKTREPKIREPFAKAFNLSNVICVSTYSFPLRKVFVNENFSSSIYLMFRELFHHLRSNSSILYWPAAIKPLGVFFDLVINNRLNLVDL